MEDLKKVARELSKLQDHLQPTPAAQNQYAEVYSALANVDNDVRPHRDSADLYIDDAQEVVPLSDLPVAREPEALPPEALDSAYEWSESVRWSCEARRMLFLDYVTNHYGDYLGATNYVNSLPRLPLWLWSRSAGGRRTSEVVLADGTTADYGDLTPWTVKKTRLFLRRTVQKWLIWASEQKQAELLRQ